MARAARGVGARNHVVAQVIKAELGVGAVGDVGLVGGFLGPGCIPFWIRPTLTQKPYTCPIHWLSRRAR